MTEPTQNPHKLAMWLLLAPVLSLKDVVTVLKPGELHCDSNNETRPWSLFRCFDHAVRYMKTAFQIQRPSYCFAIDPAELPYLFERTSALPRLEILYPTRSYTLPTFYSCTQKRSRGTTAMWQETSGPTIAKPAEGTGTSSRASSGRKELLTASKKNTEVTAHATGAGSTSS